MPGVRVPQIDHRCDVTVTAIFAARGRPSTSAFPIASGSKNSEEKHVLSLPQRRGRLHQVQTLELDRRLRNRVRDLQDQQLIAELNTASDLVAREAKYHAKCLTALYNRHRDSEKARASDTSMLSSSLALAELIAFMEESHVENRSTVFRLADLSKLYEARVNQLRGQFPLQQARAHNIHLKKRLLQNVPGLVAFNQGREVYLSYDEEVACTLKHQYNEEKDTESITMARVANSIRNDMFATSVSFTGQFDHETQIQSVPQRLLVLVQHHYQWPKH
ncbi:hypothetical protein ElyMa_006114200 [Elysia marginata]|uniref:Uncharacterized protein n=1 Tax=Elysia marginata TaxID=1093978 RepID=A0AAV4GXC1_9GAST|nr:hypothetical protein ElyMa_006114200 [Elysia marginata]